MPLPLIPVALITAIASLLTSVTNVGVAVHTAVQTANTNEMVHQNRHDVSLPYFLKCSLNVMRFAKIFDFRRLPK